MTAILAHRYYSLFQVDFQVEGDFVEATLPGSALSAPTAI